MRHVTTVSSRELRSLFVSPVAYVVLSLFAALSGLFFILNIAAFNLRVLQAQQFQAFEELQQLNLNDHLLAYFFDSMGVILLFVIPGITMGLFAAEKTNGTQELLMTSPLTIWDIVLGKFTAAAAFVTILVAMVAAFPGLLFVYGDPEFGKTASGILGLLLVGWTYAAIGAFASSVTRSQVVSFLIAFALLLGMLLLPAITHLGVAGDVAGAVFRWISTGEHFQALIGGLVNTADLAYFGVAIGVFLMLTKAAVESVRWR
ncbi:MAG: ABC transporter permease [Myxococcales bacterium]|nr:ABC transporter permease [Myxococcales bacterium]